MTATQDRHNADPLHGITLENQLKQLVEHYGWRQLSKIIEIRCFFNDPSVSSSLKFLRRTPWARAKVEKLYLDLQWEIKNRASTPGDPVPVSNGAKIL